MGVKSKLSINLLVLRILVNMINFTKHLFLLIFFLIMPCVILLQYRSIFDIFHTGITITYACSKTGKNEHYFMFVCVLDTISNSDSTYKYKQQMK